MAITYGDGGDPLPRFKCHKEVHAAKIAGIEPKGMTEGAVLRFEPKNLASIEVSAEYLRRHKPKVGGYYVVYHDGYESWSPAEAFEDGYTRLL